MPDSMTKTKENAFKLHAFLVFIGKYFHALKSGFLMLGGTMF